MTLFFYKHNNASKSVHAHPFNEIAYYSLAIDPHYKEFRSNYYSNKTFHVKAFALIL